MVPTKVEIDILQEKKTNHIRKEYTGTTSSNKTTVFLQTTFIT